MARGFAAGFGVGAVICGAGLVALSLSMPVARPPAEPTATGPTVDAIEVPAGSEFARGVDEAPVAPAELAPARVNAVGDAPAVVLPPDETAPQQGGDNDPRPETRVDAPSAPSIEPPQPDTIDLPAIPAPPAPIPVAPPGRVEVPGLDRVPGSPAPAEPRPRDTEAAERPAVSPPEPADTAPEPAAEPEETPEAPAAPAVTPEQPDAHAPVPDVPVTPEPAPQPPAPVVTPEEPASPATPALPAPGLDLSTPPDLRDLRLLERN